MAGAGRDARREPAAGDVIRRRSSDVRVLETIVERNERQPALAREVDQAAEPPSIQNTTKPSTSAL